VKVVAVVAALLALAAPAAASERHPTLAELENQIMCPVCVGETLAQSGSPAAHQLKVRIQHLIAQGKTRSEIKRELVADYGTRILAAPPRHGFDLLADRWSVLLLRRIELGRAERWHVTRSRS